VVLAAAKHAQGRGAVDAMIGFESGGRRLTTRLIAGDYIKYSSKFPADFGSCGDMPALPLAEAVGGGVSGTGERPVQPVLRDDER